MFEIDASKTRQIVGLLMDIRAALMDNNDLSLKVARRGWCVALADIETAIGYIITLETVCAEYKCKIADDRAQIEMYSNMLGGYDDGALSDERKAELKVLVDKWHAEDERK